MADATWLDLLGASLGGGFTVKLLDIGYQEIRRRSEKSRSAKKFVDDHLDPLLKATDELVGKLRSLAEDDFRAIAKIEAKAHKLAESADFAAVLYLFSRFWAQVELLRRKGLSVALGEDERGRKLQSFLDCLESRKVRIVDRISQRAVGEVMLRGDNEIAEPISFISFVHVYETDETARRWVAPLVHVLARSAKHPPERQQLLQYGTVLHALVDTLDRKHTVTKDRPAIPVKLSKVSWQNLKFRVFGRYLAFVCDPRKYLGPPKGRPQKS